MFRQLGYRLSYLQVLDNLVSFGIYNHLVAIWVANLRVQDFYKKTSCKNRLATKIDFVLKRKVR